jgi:hypothetical protein
MMEFTGPDAWKQACRHMREFNKAHGIDSKDWSPDAPICVMVAVLTPDSFDKEYDEEGRSYRFNNYNKAFLPMTSSSIFSSCLDGTDDGVRLDWYIDGGHWKVERVYVQRQDEGASS